MIWKSHKEEIFDEKIWSKEPTALEFAETVETKPVPFYIILNLLHEIKVTGPCKDYP